MKNVYVLGNKLIEEDSLPIRLLPKLKKEFSNLNFLEFDPTENMPEEEHLIVIDTVMGINKVRLFNENDDFEVNQRTSVHDYDLGFSLKLMKKLGKVNKITIIGVPVEIKEDEAIKELKRVITNLLSRNE